MIRTERMIVAESAGVPIHVDEMIRSVTFTDSPYYAHTHLSAIDIYPLNRAGFVPSPVSGQVVGIRSVKAPTSTHFKADEDEKLLLIANSDKLTTKILHLKPTVKIGETVDVSTPLGTYVRSGFFSFWTDHHIHVEVRPSDDPIRARGSFPVTPRLLGNVSSGASEQSNPNHIPCEIVSVAPEFLLLKPPNEMFGRLGGYVGLRVQVNENTRGILDGGFPHYSYGGVLLSKAIDARIKTVRMGDLSIGHIQGDVLSRNGPEQRYAMVQFKEGIRVRLSGHPLRGLALSLYLSSSYNMLLKAVPRRPYNKEELQTFRDHEVLSVTDDS
jgi:hypothetical protein